MTSHQAPEFYTCSPEVTHQEMVEGKHCDLAKENAEYNRYEGP